MLSLENQIQKTKVVIKQNSYTDEYIDNYLIILENQLVILNLLKKNETLWKK